ncbi:MAG: protein FAM72, partial [Benjaminiella poitrasii]
TKHVYKLLCKHCKAIVCVRGMKAFLLADSSVELYSTDRPFSNICVVGDDYMMHTCHCRVQDVACLECGNVIGYHIVAPCTLCLGSSNNGHLWMFCAEQCEPVERYDTNQKAMHWPNIPK